jgi:uncharacterized phage-associated protein
MATVFDVASYIISKTGHMSTMKLEKLCYYAQAWNLVWDDKPLFDERIEAWIMGPVVRDLYTAHRKQFLTTDELAAMGSPDNLDDDEKETIDVVLKSYGHLDSKQLSALTHRDNPWRDARVGYGDFDHCENEISQESMQSYYIVLENRQAYG